ncbi:hypothetical protein YC2023_071507 [Brassica napus]
MRSARENHLIYDNKIYIARPDISRPPYSTNMCQYANVSASHTTQYTSLAQTSLGFHTHPICVASSDISKEFYISTGFNGIALTLDMIGGSRADRKTDEGLWLELLAYQETKKSDATPMHELTVEQITQLRVIV